MNKAPRVCVTCKTRKKACDKWLPQCGYCAKRDLACSYSYDEPPSNRPPLQYASPSVSGPGSGLPDILISGKQMTADDMVYDQLRRIVSLTRTSIPQMSDEFFRGVHNVFPVVSAEFLQARLLIYQDQALPADFALVILSMYLLTMRSLGDSRLTETISAEAFYVTIKMLFGHVQALKSSSIYLFQASLLLATFEYACCRPYAAYLSIGTCERMAVILDRVENRQQEDCSPRNLRQVLGEDSFRGVILLERLIACEVDAPFGPSLTTHPAPVKLPQDSMSAITDTEEQAVDLLGRVLFLTKSPISFKIRGLQKVGVDLQDFLSDILAADSSASRCAPYVVIATAIRSLFLLHQHLLNNLLTYPGHSEEPSIMQISLNALNTATRIMVDTSRDHVDRGIPHDLDTFPLCGGYNLRCAMKHLREYGTISSQDVSADLAKLERLYSVFCQRWTPLGNQLYSSP